MMMKYHGVELQGKVGTYFTLSTVMNNKCTLAYVILYDRPG